MFVRTINFRLELDVLNFNASLRLPLFLTCFTSRNATSYLIYFTDSELWELVHSTENITALKYLYVIFEAGGEKIVSRGVDYFKDTHFNERALQGKTIVGKTSIKNICQDANVLNESFLFTG